METYTLHVEFTAEDDRDALVRAAKIVRTLGAKVDADTWDVSDNEDWAEILTR